MNNKEYIELKNRVIESLNNKTGEIANLDYIPSNEEEFTYDNAIKAWVCAIFIDIRNSSDFFKDNKKELIARILRAFYSEIIAFLESDNNYRDIGIRGDCVYGIYSAPKKQDLENVFSIAARINTFQKMFQKILVANNFPTFEIGIGLGASEDLVIKAGKKGSGINDYIWIGDAVVDAANNSSVANKANYGPIVLNSLFFYNIKDFKANSEHNYETYFTKKYCSENNNYVWDCNMINIHFNNWINAGMNNE